MTIKAALLTGTPESGKGVFVRVDELADESELTPNHLPAIRECDLPAGRYVWRPRPVTARSPQGGEFVAIEALDRRNRPDFDKAFAGLAGAVEALGGKLPDETRAWLAWAGKRHARRNAKGGGK